MPVPFGQVPADVAAYLQELEGRIASLESPGSPVATYTMTTAQMTTANAAEFAYRTVLNTTLNILAHSNGAHWYREDTGAQIV